jgi:2-methylcitrate dehydratase PrpD
MTENEVSGTAALCPFIADLDFGHIPPRVVTFTKGLMIDWFGSAFAGKGSRQVEAIESFARDVGPETAPSTIILSRTRTSPYFAAMVNAAASHVVEQDDVHNGSVSTLRLSFSGCPRRGRSRTKNR